MKISKDIITSDGIAVLYDNFFNATESEHLFLKLSSELAWRQETITMFNKAIVCPRLIDWSGDDGVNYTYSKNKHMTRGWNPTLLSIKNKIEQNTNAVFNFVLCNYYRHGEDYMGWHDDGEKALGVSPVIASVSLGAPRKFEFRHKTDKTKVGVILHPGSLLIMSGTTQQHWHHRLPKDTQCADARINLTFRNIIGSDHY